MTKEKVITNPKTLVEIELKNAGFKNRLKQFYSAHLSWLTIYYHSSGNLSSTLVKISSKLVSGGCRPTAKTRNCVR